MSILSIDVCPLTGATVDGGWPEGIELQENLHTLLILRTAEGLEGFGSCFTSGRLVAGAVGLLWPLLRGQSAVEPERVSETLRQATFWQGRGGSVEHAISGIDIALWDLMGKACGQPVSRLLGGDYRRTIRPYGSILFDEPEPLARTLSDVVARGFRAIKLGWRPFGRRDRAFDELLVKTARRAVGDGVEIMVDAGGSEQFWPHGSNWARNTAAMLADFGVTWFEEPLPPDDLEGYIALTRVSPVPIAGGEVLTAPTVVPPLDRTTRRGYSPARLHQERRPERVSSHRLAGPRPQRSGRPPRLEHRRRPRGGSPVFRRHPDRTIRRIPDPEPLYR